MQTITLPKIYSKEEYLSMEEKAEFKSEYNNGEIIPMTGASIKHNRIIINLIIALTRAITDENCEIFANDLRLWIPEYNQYTYPDVMIIKGEPIFEENRTDTIMNPSIIFEVLSKSTSSNDRGDKFNFYRSIPQFQEYVLIDQYQVHIEHFSKTSDGNWLFTESKKKDGILKLVSVNCEIKHQDIYQRVTFEN
jgi:Uma2 family endonuclease